MRAIETLTTDLRYALRVLARQPAFTAVAALTLALGIAASSAIFSLVDGILLRPLPFANAGELVEVLQSYPEQGLARWTLSQANVATYRDRVKAFSAFAAHARTGTTLLGDGPAERLTAEAVTVDFFKVLGVEPAVGRTFVAEEGIRGNDNAVVLSYGFWQSHFAGDHGVVGRTINLLGQPTRVVGVMGPGFSFPRPDVQVYLPLVLDPTRARPNFLTGLARLRPGVSIALAKREVTDVMYDWTRQTPGVLAAGVDPRSTRMGALTVPLREAMTGDVAKQLTLLQAAVLLILLLAIANVATLLSSRATARRREIAMRTALGATGARIAQQLLTESVALAAAGGAIGIALAFGLVRAFTHSGVASLPRIEEVSVDGRVLAFTVLTTVLSGVLFGLAPILDAGRRRLGGGMAGQKSSATGEARATNNVLIVAQIGLCFVLLVSAGLVVKSFGRLMRTDLGFEPAGVTSMTMPLPAQRYMMGDSSRDRNIAFVANVVERISALPGVQAAGVIFPAIYANDVNSDGYVVENHAPPAGTSSETQAVQLSITPGVLRTLQMRLRHGRDFTSADQASTTPVVIVDDELAHRYWAGAEALGKRVRSAGDTTWRTIVGVVASIRDEQVATPARPHMFVPYAQLPGSRPSLAIRAAASLSGGAEIRRLVASLDPGIAVTNVRPLTDAIAITLEQRRLTQRLLTSFAALALVLAAIGLYGVISIYVANRRREFGIRLAVGATPPTLVRLVLREGATLAGIGTLIGAVGAILTSPLIRAELYDVSPADPVVFALLAVGLLAVATLSCYLPARRAAKSDPLVALRSD